MVDFDAVKEKLKRGALVGAGSFASGLVGSRLTSTDGFNLSEMNASFAKIAIGAGVSIGGEELDLVEDEAVEEVAEYVGYGMQGDGFSDLAENIETGALGGTSSTRTVEVKRGANGGSTSSTTTTSGQEEEFLIDS